MIRVTMEVDGHPAVGLGLTVEELHQMRFGKKTFTIDIEAMTKGTPPTFVILWCGDSDEKMQEELVAAGFSFAAGATALTPAAPSPETPA